MGCLGQFRMKPMQRTRTCRLKTVLRTTLAMEDSAKQRREGPPLVFEAKALRNPFVSEYSVFYLTILYFLALAPFTPGLASAENAANIFSNLLPLLIVAMGQTVVLITGGIDLSAPSTIALSSVVGAMVMSGDQGWLGGSRWATPAAIVIMLLAGAGVGLFNGAAITLFRMPAFIVTLTTMMFASGAAIWLTKSKTIYNLPVSFNAIGKGSLFIVPYALIVTALLALALHTMLTRTLFGRRLYATGHNVKAALVSGVPVGRTVTLAYVISGLCASSSSILYTGRMETGSPVLSQRILLDVIGAAVIGGVSLFGGKGKIAWAVCGALFITLIDNSLNMLGLSYFFIMMVKGAVILLAALLDAWRNRLIAGR
jgi:ribose/xylose/arabinose/galactoside ABC-type transport system permease subunit